MSTQVVSSVLGLSNKHPNFVARETDWTIMRDAYGGERYVKDKAFSYLPATGSMEREGIGTGQPGLKMYQAYLTRAVYHELVQPSVMAMLGVMHHKDATIELPSALEPLRKRATFNGESLHWLLQKINEEQMLMGRYGIMPDIADGAKASDLPYIVGYCTEHIPNWDSTRSFDQSGMRKLKFVVLDESAYVRRTGLAWNTIKRYRVLVCAEEVEDLWKIGGLDTGATGYYAAGVEHTDVVAPSEFTQPQLGGKTLDQIPFVFIGPRDLVPEPDKPPFMPMARLALAIYRTEADYRQAGFMQGQDTLVIKGQHQNPDGTTTQPSVGAFGAIFLPADAGAEAKYIGAESDGMDQLEHMIQNDFKRAAQLGAQLLTERGNEAESGEALNIRVASRTATLTTVAKCGAAGLERALRIIAEWKGADPDKVLVKPNLDFADAEAQAQDLVYMMTAKSQGLKLSHRSIHNWMKNNDFTSMTFEEEEEECKQEEPMTPMVPGAKRGVPGKPAAAEEDY